METGALSGLLGQRLMEEVGKKVEKTSTELRGTSDQMKPNIIF